MRTGRPKTGSSSVKTWPWAGASSSATRQHHHRAAGRSPTLAPGSALAHIAAAVADKGVRSVEIDSECKLTDDGLAGYCRAFPSRGLQVEAVIVPIERYPGSARRTCPTE